MMGGTSSSLRQQDTQAYGNVHKSDKLQEQLNQDKQQETQNGQESSCPVPQSLRQHYVYNVYSQRIDEQDSDDSDITEIFRKIKSQNNIDYRNLMPAEANQFPSLGQKFPLSTTRQQSSIPKGNTEENWVYPSQQMFYNALQRKGKGDDVPEQNMVAVVNQHNRLNEKTWQDIQLWEHLHNQQKEKPQLVRFEGKYDQMSPLARLKYLLGYGLPFDRHDWYIQRGDRYTRYVIDFYFDESQAGSIEAFNVVTRPALDTFDSCIDRIKFNIYTNFAYYGLPCPLTGHKSQDKFVNDNNQPIG